MESNEYEIRNTAKAICYNKDGSLLMLKKEYEDGSVLYTLPGGSQEPGESLEAALIRECEEEIGTTVTVESLQYICEYIKKSRTPGKKPRHKVEFGFTCSLPESYSPRMGSKPDSHQVEVLWMEAEQLHSAVCVPKELALCLNADGPPPFYRGL